MSTIKTKLEKYKSSNQNNKIATLVDSKAGVLFSYKDNPKAQTLATNALEQYSGISRADAARTDWKNIEPYTSIRDSFSRDDYEYFRPNESLPQKQQDIIQYCMEAYRKIGIVRNVIDLMGDFGAQGVQLNHPNPKIQKFYRAWFSKVNGKERSERFLNLLYRCANVIVKRRLATLDVKSNKFSALASKTISSDGPTPDNLQTKRGVIPIRYTFLNPLTLTPIGGELAQFIGKTYYGIKLPFNLVNSIQYPKTAIEQQLVAQLPKDIIEAAKSSNKVLPLDNQKLSVFHYKKDDWQIWADPLVYAILSDLITLEKMKLADLAALDGAISQIRIWKLGNLEAELFPTDAAINKLNEILLSNPGGGAFDVIWGPDLEVKDYNTNVHQFLGDSKYVPVRNSIYEGLGVPPTLTGGSASAGFTNNYISLKTLVQRLEYGRTQLRTFWEQEIELVRQAMGFRVAATISFDNMILSDEAAEKALLVQMVDRNILSLEAVQDIIGANPELERIRMKREDKDRETGKMVPKAGPWFNPEKTFEFMKIALGRGYVTPKQSGLDVEEEFEEPPFIKQLKQANKSTNTLLPDDKNGDQPQKGRPKNSKDTKPRGGRTTTIRTAAENTYDFDDDAAKFLTRLTWAKHAHSQISDIIVPAVLSACGKKTVRNLSSEESQSLESLKFATLANMDLFADINKDGVLNIMMEEKLHVPTNFNTLCKELVSRSEKQFSRPLSLDELRNIQIAVYSFLKE